MNDSQEEARDRLRAEREQREADRLKENRRRKRGVALVSGAAVIAIAVVAALIILGGGSSDKADDAPETKSLLAGVPQKGTVLGDPDGPVTVVEFVDLQCPFCRDYSLEALPGVIKNYVRTGKVKLDLRVLAFLGPDSEKGGQVAYAASKQNKLWDFSESFFRDQGEENSGYVTDGFLRKVAGKASGLDVDAAFKARDGGAAQDFLDKSSDDAERYKVDSTPAFVALRKGEQPKKLEIEELTLAGFSDKIDPLLK